MVSINPNNRAEHPPSNLIHGVYLAERRQVSTQKTLPRTSFPCLGPTDWLYILHLTRIPGEWEHACSSRTVSSFDAVQ